MTTRHVDGGIEVTVRVGDCPQCVIHAEVFHAGNWLGLADEDDCEECVDHMENGHDEIVVGEPLVYTVSFD